MAKKDKTEAVGLDAIINELNKKFGAGTVATNQIMPGIEFLSSGCMALDKALGGGWARGRIVELIGLESSGKAQPLTCKVLTPTGWKLMQDIKIGDIVCTPDGGDSTIIGVYPQPKQKIYKITFDDKSFTRCSYDHLWLVYTRTTDLGEILTTGELISRGLKNQNTCRRFKIPQIEPLQFNGNVILPIDPYLLGLLLGDGSLVERTIKFTTIDLELLNNIQKILDRDFPEMTISEKQGKCSYSLKKKKHGHELTRLYQELEKLGLTGKYSEEKFIPKVYLFASIEQRIALLQGLMDTDGSVDPDGSISYPTSSPQLSLDFQFLVKSLGIRSTTSSRITKYTSANGNKVDGLPSFRSSLLLNKPFKVVQLSRKVKNLNPKLSDYRFRYIESIEEWGEEECQCIKIGHPDQLYITDDFIVTHNTSTALHAVAEAQKLGEKAAYIDIEHALDPNYMQKLGVNLEQLIITQPNSGEEALDIAEALIRSGEISLIIVDSVAALVPQKELEGNSGDSSMGLQARLMSQGMRKLAAITHQTNTILMFLNQIRMKIGMVWGNPETTPGGLGLKFAASQRLDLRRKDLLKEGDTAIGNYVQAKVVKNKVGPPFKECTFIIKYGEGIDKYMDLIEVAKDKGVLVKNGAWYSYGEAKVAQGDASMVQLLKDTPVLFDEIKEKIK
jgi:recombination protein RecA